MVAATCDGGRVCGWCSGSVLVPALVLMPAPGCGLLGCAQQVPRVASWDAQAWNVVHRCYSHGLCTLQAHG